MSDIAEFKEKVQERYRRVEIVSIIFAVVSILLYFISRYFLSPEQVAEAFSLMIYAVIFFSGVSVGAAISAPG
jgi:hypothetical protein